MKIRKLHRADKKKDTLTRINKIYSKTVLISAIAIVSVIFLIVILSVKVTQHTLRVCIRLATTWIL